MSIYINKESCGLPKSILITDDVVKLTDEPCPIDSWHVGNNAFRSLTRVALATNHTLSLLPDDPRIAWWAQWCDTPRIDKILMKESVSSHIRRLVDSCKKLLNSDSYFLEKYQEQNRLLDMLKPAHASINEIRENQVDPESFACDNMGVCVKPEYDNFSSSTGRMSIKAGPKLLTMPRENRRFFTSTYGTDGAIMSIDFKSLEPRVIMTLMGEKDLDPDIYDTIMRKTGIKIDRDIVKTMVLSVLYGMSRKNFILKFMEHEDVDIAYDKLQHTLGVKKILAQIKNDMVDNTFRNFYGRPLKSDNESVLVNHYTQSTAVDVACEGFLSFLDNNPDLVRPLFVLHDELIIDVHKDNIVKLKEQTKDGIFIKSLGAQFYTTTRIFNGRKDH